MNSKIRLLSVVCLWSVSACAHGRALEAQECPTDPADAVSGTSSEEIASPSTAIAAPTKALLPENLRNLTYLGAYTSVFNTQGESKVAQERAGKRTGG